MLVPKNPSWLRIIFYWSGTALSRTWARLVLVLVVAIVVTVLHVEYHAFKINLTLTPFTLVGLALSIFLGFRNNTSYDRFWEGRKLWGSLVNTSRSAARQYFEMIGPTPETPKAASEEETDAVRRELVYAISGYVHALRLHLREVNDLEPLEPFFDKSVVDALAIRKNRPIALLDHIGVRLRELWRRGLVHTMHLPLLEQTLEKLTDIQGACERIKSTPIPFAYTVLIHRIVAIYCFTLPFGIVDTIGVLTPIVVLLIAYAFFGLDALGDAIEDPFGTDKQDLPLNALSRMIEINLRQTLGETDLPPPIAPEGDVLM